MNIEALRPSYGIAVMGDYCINCAEYAQYYLQRKEGNYTIHTAVDRGYCIKRQCITRPGNRCKYYQEKSEIEAREAI